MPTDTERLDFLEQQGRDHALSMQAFGSTKYAWGDCYSGLSISAADGELFYHETARASIDYAMMRAGVLTPAQPKPAPVPFSDTEPDEPVVQEVGVDYYGDPDVPGGVRYFEPSAQRYFTTEVNRLQIKEETRG